MDQRISGLYGIADAQASGGDPERTAAALLEGGCRLVQLRCKGWSPDDVLPVARAVARRCVAVGAVFIVNDDPMLAVASGAHGVHVGQTDTDPIEARRIVGRGAIVGRSTHSPEQAREAAAHADYVAFGPVFPTPHLSRPKEVRGVDALARVRQVLPGHVPLVAIGGITAGRLGEVRAAGAQAWAVIGAVAGAEDAVAAVRGLVG